MYDVITLGSATVDAFVKARKEIRKHDDHFDICFHLGEKLLIEDLVLTTGGGGTNSAVAFSRLGLKTAFVGAIGNDLNGKLILSELKKENVDFLGKVKNEKSGFSVILKGNSDRTILSYKGINNNLLFSDIKLSNLNSKWMYISTMLGKSFETAKKIADYGKKHNIKIACNSSPYLAKLGLVKLSSFLKNIDILILNKDEAFDLSGKKSIKDEFSSISRYVSGIIVITDSYSPIHAHYNGKIYRKNIKKIKAVDTTGAGDAFASGFIYGIIKGKDILKSLNYGHKESSSVLMHIGAKNNLLRRL